MKTLTVSMTQEETTFGWAYFLVQFFLLPSLLRTANGLFSSPLSKAQINILYFTLNFAATGLIFRKFLLRSFQILRENPIRVLRYACIFLSLYFLSNYLCSWVAHTLRPDFANRNDQSISIMLQEQPLLMRIGTVFLVPMAEETLFRGLIFQGLYRKNRLLAYGISTLAFGAVHVMGYIGQYDPALLTLSLLQYLPAGIILGLAYAKTDTIWAPIAMHIAINQVGILSMA